jgi:hypothetical protein
MRWAQSWRIVRSIYPPVDLFEDVADPADWELIVSALAKLDPAVRDGVGNLALVPVERRIAGPGASMVMGVFTHASRARPSRFSDGTYGVWYCGDRPAVALAETAYHFERFMRATAEPPAEADFRELTCAVHGDWQTVPPGPCLDPEDWSAGQDLGRTLRAEGGDGVVYPSVRHPAGMAAGLFWPDGVVLPVVRARQLRYGWDGTRMHRYFVHGSEAWCRP